MRGRKPKPVALRLLAGDVGKRKPHGHAPRPDPSMPAPSMPLDAAAQAAWDELAPVLHAAGCLTRADGFALTRYCKLWSRWRSAMDEVEEHGAVVELRGKDGRLRTARPHPAFRVAMDTASTLLRLETEFGMTPASRQRIHLPATSESDPLARFLDGRNGA